MARPQTASDDEILQASLRVMVRRGHDAFTLSEVAAEVGLSRAAIILRFKGTHALKVRLTTYIVDRFVQSLRSLPSSRGGDGLLELVAFIGQKVSSPGSLAAFMRTYHSNIEDKELLRLERKRGAALRAAVAERMPSTAITRDSAVTAFGAHISGCLMQWEVQTGTDARCYLVERTKQWLTLAQIPHDKNFGGRV
jgi:AcrR family transcriptional regulator